mgnify:CR=1 FL=1
MKSFIEESRQEVLARSLAPAITFAILAALVFVIPKLNEAHVRLVGWPCLIIIVTSLWRVLLYFRWQKKKDDISNIWRQFSIASIINSVCWGTALGLVVYQNENSPLIVTFALLIAAAIGNASIYTLGNATKLHIPFVVLILVPLTGISSYRYCLSLDSGDLGIAIILLLGMIYMLSQGRVHRRRFAEKMKADNDLFSSQQELLQQRAMTEHANRLASVGEMAAGFAHEINNPLMIITGNLELLQTNLAKSNADAQAVKHASRALNASLRITKIVKSLRTLSHRSATDGRDWHAISTILTDTLELYVERIESKQIRISTELVEQKIWCDDVQIMQVFLNLFNNAIDAVQDLPEADRWIKVVAETQTDMLWISVTNGGKAIDKDLMAKIFTPFFTTKPVGQGMGLGLAISRSLALRHKGELQVQHADGHTCFRLLLPLTV